MIIRTFVPCLCMQKERKRRKKNENKTTSSHRNFRIMYTVGLVYFQYRHYEDQLLQYKSWCMIWVIVAIVPIGLVNTLSA